MSSKNSVESAWLSTIIKEVTVGDTNHKCKPSSFKFSPLVSPFAEEVTPVDSLTVYGASSDTSREFTINRFIKESTLLLDHMMYAEACREYGKRRKYIVIDQDGLVVFGHELALELIQNCPEEEVELLKLNFGSFEELTRFTYVLAKEVIPEIFKNKRVIDVAIIRIYNTGISNKDIAKLLQVSESTISRHINKYARSISNLAVKRYELNNRYVVFLRSEYDMVVSSEADSIEVPTEEPIEEQEDTCCGTCCTCAKPFDIPEEVSEELSEYDLEDPTEGQDEADEPGIFELYDEEDEDIKAVVMDKGYTVKVYHDPQLSYTHKELEHSSGFRIYGNNPAFKHLYDEVLDGEQIHHIEHSQRRHKPITAQLYFNEYNEEFESYAKGAEINVEESSSKTCIGIIVTNRLFEIEDGKSMNLNDGVVATVIKERDQFLAELSAFYTDSLYRFEIEDSDGRIISRKGEFASISDCLVYALDEDLAIISEE